MNSRYVGWVILKSIMGSLLMFDSLLIANSLHPDEGIARAVLTTGNASLFFAGYFLIFTALIGGVGFLTENYHWKGDEKGVLVK